MFQFSFRDITTLASELFMLTGEKLADQTCQLTVTNDNQASIHSKLNAASFLTVISKINRSHQLKQICQLAQTRLAYVGTHPICSAKL